MPVIYTPAGGKRVLASLMWGSNIFILCKTEHASHRNYEAFKYQDKIPENELRHSRWRKNGREIPKIYEQERRLARFYSVALSDVNELLCLLALSVISFTAVSDKSANGVVPHTACILIFWGDHALKIDSHPLHGRSFSVLLSLANCEQFIEKWQRKLLWRQFCYWRSSSGNECTQRIEAITSRPQSDKTFELGRASSERSDRALCVAIGPDGHAYSIRVGGVLLDRRWRRPPSTLPAQSGGQSNWRSRVWSRPSEVVSIS